MFRNLLQQLNSRKRQYWITLLIVFLSFIVITVVLSFVYENQVKTFSPRLSLNISNRAELLLEWKFRKLNSEHKEVRKQLKRSIEKIPNVEIAEFVINDIIVTNFHHAYDRYSLSKDSYLMYCGEDFHKVFELNVSGRWFKPSNNSIYPEAVITREHAKKLGITSAGKSARFSVAYRGRNAPDSITYSVVGIIENLGFMQENRKFARTVAPIFISITDKDNKYYSYFDERLILKMKPGCDFATVNDRVEMLMQSERVAEYCDQYQFTTMRKKFYTQIWKQMKRMNLFYGTMFILLSYLFVTLFGNFWRKIMVRIPEIGIRRAIGHRKRSVLIYIMLESFAIYFISVGFAVLFLASLPVKFFTELSGIVYLLSAGVVFFVVFIATLIPAIRAARVTPVEALAEE